MRELVTALDPQSVAAIERGFAEFNSGKFFECHDTLEEVWRGVRGPARDFLQGLIQVSVGFYHLSGGNLRGGESQLVKGLAKLSTYDDNYLGLDNGAIRNEVERWLQKVRNGEGLRATLADLPKLRFLP